MRQNLSIREYIINNFGEEAITTYMSIARGSSNTESDFLALRAYILERGKSPYQAVELLYGSGLTTRSKGTLDHHIKDILRDIAYYFFDFEEKLKRLQQGEPIHVPEGLAFIMRRVLNDSGDTFREDIRFRRE